MKDLSTFLGISCLIILFAYIIFNESRDHTPPTKMSDEEVADAQFVMMDQGPLPAISFDVPQNASFAGEPMPLNLPDVKERLDKELQINTYFHSNTIFLIKRANRWLPQIEKILKEHDIPEDFKYLPLIESNLMNVISPAEAVGYWQILKTSGKEFGLEISDEVDERYDPLKATVAACKYLNQAYRKFGNWTLVAASYNRGMGGVERAIENQGEKNYYDLFLNEETSRYVFRIVAIKEIIENPSRYGFKVSPKHLYAEEPLKYVDVDETVKDMITFAKRNGTNYKLIKRHNPWLRDDRLTVKKGKRYRIAIPQS
jgi:membrane-bound lytic murein transglycosylase D